MRRQHENAFDEDSQRLDIQSDEQDVHEPAAIFPVGGAIDPGDDESVAERDLEEEKDVDAPEGDDALLSGHSPEFQRLVKHPKSQQ